MNFLSTLLVYLACILIGIHATSGSPSPNVITRKNSPSSKSLPGMSGEHDMIVTNDPLLPKIPSRYTVDDTIYEEVSENRINVLSHVVFIHSVIPLQETPPEQ